MDEKDRAGKDAAGRRELSRRELLKMVVPAIPVLSWSRLLLDSAKCSACGLCARECHRQALAASGDRGLVLTFQSSLCDACGKCVEVCPEKCLTPEAKGSGQPATPVVLFTDEFARCRVCHAVIGSRAMIERVAARLQTKDPALAAQIQLCPACRGKGGGHGDTQGQ